MKCTGGINEALDRDSNTKTVFNDSVNHSLTSDFVFFVDREGAMKWPMLRFPPINLFSAPVQMKICRHTHWANYVSWGKQVCIDCNKERPLHMKIEHQR